MGGADGCRKCPEKNRWKLAMDFVEKQLSDTDMGVSKNSGTPPNYPF